MIANKRFSLLLLNAGRAKVGAWNCGNFYKFKANSALFVEISIYYLFSISYHICSGQKNGYYTSECGLVSSVGMATTFSARRWVPYAGRAWVRILVVLDNDNLNPNPNKTLTLTKP